MGCNTSKSGIDQPHQKVGGANTPTAKSRTAPHHDERTLRTDAEPEAEPERVKSGSLTLGVTDPAADARCELPVILGSPTGSIPSIASSLVTSVFIPNAKPSANYAAAVAAAAKTYTAVTEDSPQVVQEGTAPASWSPTSAASSLITTIVTPDVDDALDRTPYALALQAMSNDGRATSPGTCDVTFASTSKQTPFIPALPLQRLATEAGVTPFARAHNHDEHQIETISLKRRAEPDFQSTAVGAGAVAALAPNNVPVPRDPEPMFKASTKMPVLARVEEHDELKPHALCCHDSKTKPMQQPTTCCKAPLLKLLSKRT